MFGENRVMAAIFKAYRGIRNIESLEEMKIRYMGLVGAFAALEPETTKTLLEGMHQLRGKVSQVAHESQNDSEFDEMCKALGLEIDE